METKLTNALFRFMILFNPGGLDKYVLIYTIR